MAISKAMRQDIMELAVLMNNKAPGTKLLGELVTAANSGKTLEQIAETLAARAEFTAKYPLHQTAEDLVKSGLLISFLRPTRRFRRSV